MIALIACNELSRLNGILATRLVRGIRESAGSCENCGSMVALTCHHIKKRCNNGSDYGDNLVVLCTDCHNALHWIEGGKE